jgi:hypothetical protein
MLAGGAETLTNVTLEQVCVVNTNQQYGLQMAGKIMIRCREMLQVLIVLIQEICLVCFAKVNP